MASSPSAPQTVGNYVVERALARGSMGHVYVAHHALTHARVALKVLRAEIAGDTQAEERFLREVRAAAHIGHEGIVQVHDAGRTSDGLLYLAMELLEGETFEARLRRSPGERWIAMNWLLAVLDPLCAAHEQGIVHRDLKPANVFIALGQDGKERLKLLDFGLARDMREKSMTATGIALGTPYYMSPEQATQPRLVGTPSDVWSMGVMMYEVLCGVMPFDGETLHAVVIQASVSPHVPVLERQPELDPGLAALVDRCLSKEPEARPHDARALRELLTPLLNTPQVRAGLDQPVPVVPRLHASPTAAEAQSDSERMPFAETAISLMPGDDQLEAARRMRNHARVRGTGVGLWMLLLGLLATGAVGFFWLMHREDTAAAAQPQEGLVTQAAAGRPTPADARRNHRARRSGEGGAATREKRGDAAQPQLAQAVRDAGTTAPSPDAAAALPASHDASVVPGANQP